MTFHHRRIGAVRKVKHLRDRQLLIQGAQTINLWNVMPTIKLGSVSDDWKAVGADMHRAMSTYADECG